MADVDLTELVEMDPTRLDGVKTPASGLPFLIMKSVAKDVDKKGRVDETPDISNAEAVLRLLATLIESEARELGAGNWEEVCDIDLLASAAHTIKYFRLREQMTADGENAMKSLESAVIGRATELGVSNPMAVPELTPPITEPTVTAPVTEDAPIEKSIDERIAEAVAKATEDAVAKAMSDRDETITGLRSEMAALKAQPLPGSPFVTNATVAKSTAAPTAEIDRFERLAKSTQDRELARYYADRARELKGSQN